MICLVLKDFLRYETFFFLDARIRISLVKSGWLVTLVYGTKSCGLCACISPASVHYFLLRINTTISLPFRHPFPPSSSYPPNAFCLPCPQTLMKNKVTIETFSTLLIVHKIRPRGRVSWYPPASSCIILSFPPCVV